MSQIVQTEDYDRLRATINDAEEQWGLSFDNENTLNDWTTYVGIYTARAALIENKDDTAKQYDALIKAAGLALTAAARVRQGEIMLRHYDG